MKIIQSLSKKLIVINLILFCFYFNGNAQLVNNLVQNPSFENTTCGNFSGCLVEPFNSNVNCVTNWKAAVGTPNLCLTSNGFGAYDGQKFASCSASSQNVCRTESFGQGLQLFGGQPYNISLACRTGNVHANEPPVNIVVYGKTTPIPNVVANGGLGNCPTDTSYKPLVTFPNFKNSSWQILNQNFTPSLDLKAFIIWPAIPNPNLESSTNFDAVSISCESLMNPDFSYTILPNNTVQFTDLTNTNINGLTVAYWYWEFGDGTTSTYTNPIHTFSNPLTREVCLNIRDSRGCTDRICKTIEFPGLKCFCTNGTNVNGGANGVLLSSLNLSNNLTNTCISVSGKLIVDVNQSIDQSRLVMSTGSEIEVRNNAKLTIMNTTLSACESMWKGVTVLNGGAINFDYNLIIGAQYGVKADSGSTISVSRTEFNQNYIGLYIIRNVGLSDSSALFGFKDNIFSGGRLLPNFSGMSPSATESFSGVFIFDSRRSYSIDGNLTQFYNLKRGVDLQGDSVTIFVNNSSFFDCNNAIYASTSSLTAARNSIKNSIVGINLNAAMNRAIKIFNNKIYANTCIQALLIKGGKLNIENNDSLMLKTNSDNGSGWGIRVINCNVPTNNSIGYNKIYYNRGVNINGIEILSSPGLKAFNNVIKANTVYGENPGNFNDLSDMTGIKLNGPLSMRDSITTNEVIGANLNFGKAITVTGAVNWKICGNTLEKTTEGIDFNNNCISYLGLQLNKMKSHGKGVDISNRSTAVGQQWTNGQFNPNLVIGTGNDWEMNQFPTQTGLYADPLASILANSFRVFTPSTANNYMPNVVNAPIGLIVPDADENILSCGQILPIVDPNTNDRIARKNFETAVIDNPTVYMMQRSLYDQMLNGSISNANGNSTAIQDSFFLANQNTNLGLFASIDKQIEDYIFADIYNTSTLHTIMNQNAAIQTTAIWELNEQKVNALRINRLLAQNMDFDANEQMELLNIAAQCPRSNGLTVYHARGMYAQVNPTIDFNDDLLCSFESIEPRVSKKEVLNENITISPNPTEGIFTVFIPNQSNITECNLTVYDLVGKVILQKAIQNSSTLVDLSQQRSGMYIIQIKNSKRLDSKVIATEKIILQK